MFSKLKNKILNILFFARNINAARRVFEIKRGTFGDFVFRGYSPVDVGSIAAIYQELNGGAVFSRLQRKLYMRIGRRCLFVVESMDMFGVSRIIAMNMYYFNRRDIRDNTVHEGFIGVLPEFGGRGIATKMRKMAVEHFSVSGFSGISTRITLDNTASLVSARKIGFQPVEKYEEPATGEQRYYMICKF
ncbi:GNAT family N-acetyltransferase [Ectopseudomonas mendocina]